MRLENISLSGPYQATELEWPGTEIGTDDNNGRKDRRDGKKTFPQELHKKLRRKDASQVKSRNTIQLKTILETQRTALLSLATSFPPTAPRVRHLQETRGFNLPANLVRLGSNEPAELQSRPVQFRFKSAIFYF